MNINISFFIVWISVLCLFFQIQVSAQYRISKNVFGNGGTKLTDNNYQLNSTLGQALIGETDSPNYVKKLGFWCRGGIPPADSITWQVNLIVADAGNISETLTFGQAPTATAGLDTSLDEADLPPPPPPGSFDARFELPGTTIGSLKDFRNDVDESIIWRFRFQPGAGGVPITLSWNRMELPDKSFFLKDEVTGDIVKINMKNQDSYTVDKTALTSLIIEMTSVLTCTVKVAAGWNIISAPLQATDMSVVALFPGAASNAFQFNNGYIPVTTLSNGVGYWLKFNYAGDYPIQGLEVSPKQMPVNAAWNIVGPFESDVPVAQISSEPAGIIQSDFFEFDNGYKNVATLRVGKGYWVKVSQAGTLLVQSGSGLNKNAATDIGNDFSTEKINTLPRLVIEDSNGQTRTLYLSLKDDQFDRSESPPVPPSGVFDVRFSSDRWVESLNGTDLEILISSAQFPAKLSAKNLGGVILNVKDEIGGLVLNQSLTEENELVIPRSMNKIFIKSAEPSVLPSQYHLSQNYPNPFNPTSVISYALPEANHVRISVYNILGKKVADLVDEPQPAGYHQVEIDALYYASGIYYYVMKAKGFSAIKKMAIVK